jgi:hypothetical protein
LKTIGKYAFNECSGLRHLKFSYSLGAIKAHAFEKCTSLTSVEMPPYMYSFGEYVFAGCTNLDTVIFPESSVNVSIGAHAFDGCTSLRSVTLHDNNFRIYEGAFKGCVSLPKFTIPSTVERIEASAFEGCTSLDSVTCLVEEPYAFGKDAFKNISPKCVLTVPYGKRAAYIAKGWTTKIFKGGIVELPAPEGIQAVRVDKADKGTYYDLEGREITNPEKGRIYIRAGRKVLVK